LAHRVERLLHVAVLSKSVTFSNRVLRCLSVTAVTITTATELGALCDEPVPHAVIVLADGYPAQQVIKFVRDRLRSSEIACIALISEDPCQFQVLQEAEGSAERVALFSLSVWGWNVLDAVLSLSARLAIDVRRTAMVKDLPQSPAGQHGLESTRRKPGKLD
jgi:hypothetical protein